MSRTKYVRALWILAVALTLPAAAPAASDKWDNRCCMMNWALDLSGPRDYLPGIAHLGGEIKTAGKPYTWYLFDKRGNPVSKKFWVCRGNVIKANGTYMNGLLDTRRLERGGLYYWIIESKQGRTRHRYAHPFRMPTKPITAYGDGGKIFASRLRTRELPFGQRVKDALAGKPLTGGAVGSGRGAGVPKPPSDFTASYDPSGDGTPLLVTFRNPTSPQLGSVRVYWKEGDCPKNQQDPGIDGAHFVDPAKPGQLVRIDARLPSFAPGSAERRVCVAAWSLGKDYSASARVTATFELPSGAG